MPPLFLISAPNNSTVNIVTSFQVIATPGLPFSTAEIEDNGFPFINLYTTFFFPSVGYHKFKLVEQVGFHAFRS
jgi:hypothetical protein